MKTVDEYMALPYHVWMVRDDTDGEPAWVVGVDELPGCLSQGDTPAEAAEMIQEAMEAWIETRIERGWDIPLPRPESTHSGKFQVRVPQGLHAALDEAARHEGVSLNSLVVSLLAAGVGWAGAVDGRVAVVDPIGARIVERVLHALDAYFAQREDTAAKRSRTA